MTPSDPDELDHLPARAIASILLRRLVRHVDQVRVWFRRENIKVWLPRVAMVGLALLVIAGFTIWREHQDMVQRRNADMQRAYETWKAEADAKARRANKEAQEIDELRKKGLCNKFIPGC